MKSISSMATRHVLADLIEAAAAAGLPRVELESTGGVDAAQRVADGENLDLVFLASGALQKLADAGHVDPATITPLVLSEVAVAVPSGDDTPAQAVHTPAFPDADALQEALREASSIGYSTGPSGNALITYLTGWGIDYELEGRLIQAKPGVPVAKSVAAGDVVLGFQQLSELVGEPGVRILGVMPDDAPITTVFSGAVATKSSDPAGAARVLAFMASDGAKEIKTAHSFAVPERIE